MTHFNHEWDTTKTPTVPVSVGDRYYAQDLNDDFNYLKHLPYEVFLQGRSRGVMMTPNDTWDNDTNSLTLSGGFGVVLQDCIELDPDESFVIPPKTHSSPRYERISFADTVLVLPNDDAMHYIVATPTKRSLLQRTKALFAEQYASRVRYDGIITIQDTAPTAGQILIGLCHNKEYCLLIDINPDQCKDSIILKKWFGQNQITHGFVASLQTYYGTSIVSVETNIFIDTVNRTGIRGGTFNNCTIFIDTVNGIGIQGGIFNNCTITISTVSKGIDIQGGTFNNCIITISTVNGDVSSGITGGIFNNCTITISTVNGGVNGVIGNGTFNNCTIFIDTVNGDVSSGITGGTFNNCAITISTVNGVGIQGGIFNNCTITISTVNTNGTGVGNNNRISLYLTRIICSSTTDLSRTKGKLDVLNTTVLHAS